jgi:hypothetical protein
MDRGDARLMPTRDHVIPASRGGRTKIICCQTCNGIKADMLPGEWIVFMEQNPSWWLLSRIELRRIRRRARGLPVVNRPRGIHTVRQGTAPLPPVVVPPELIWS